MSDPRPAGTVVEVGDGAAIPLRSDRGLFTAWRIAFFGAIAALAYLAWSRPDPYWRLLKFLPDGLLVTFEVTVGRRAQALFRQRPAQFLQLAFGQAGELGPFDVGQVPVGPAGGELGDCAGEVERRARQVLGGDRRLLEAWLGLGQPRLGGPCARR